MAMVEQSQQLPHETCRSCLVEVVMSFEYVSQGLALPVLDNYIESMIILEEFVDLGDCEVVDGLEFVDLLFEEGAFVTAYLVLVDNVDCPGHGRFLVDGLPQLVKLIVFETRGQEFVVVLDAGLYLLNEISGQELDLVAMPCQPDCCVFLRVGGIAAAHSVLFDIL